MDEVHAVDGADIVVKTYHPGFEYRLATEATALRLVDGLDLPAPAILAQAHDLLVLRRLAGERLDEVARDRSNSTFDPVYAELGSHLRRLHAIEMDGFGGLGHAGHVDRVADARTAYDERLESALRDWVEHGGDRTTARAAETMAAGSTDASWWSDCRPVLCHGDLSTGNVLVGDAGTGRALVWRVTGIVDFEAAYAGDPVGDIARVGYHASRHQAGWARAFVDGYGLTDRQREVFRAYELLHALELWAWFAQAGPRAELSAVAGDIVRLLETLSADAGT